MLHIDLGYCLGNSPGGNFGFETAAFKLTYEMVQVYHTYLEICDELLLRKECLRSPTHPPPPIWNLKKYPDMLKTLLLCNYSCLEVCVPPFLLNFEGMKKMTYIYVLKSISMNPIGKCVMLLKQLADWLTDLTVMMMTTWYYFVFYCPSSP